MPIVLAVAKLRHSSLLARDTDDNSFVFESEDSTPMALVTALEGANCVQNFYNAHTGGEANAIAHYLGECLDRSSNAAEIDYYDITAHLDGSPHGGPIHVSRFTLGAEGADARELPAENGAVVTLAGSLRAAAPVQGPRVSTIPTPAKAQRLYGAAATHEGNTRPKQTRTGRLYLGPLNSMAFVVASGEVFLEDQFLVDATGACKHLLAVAGGLTVTANWSVWSRRLHELDNIVGGFADNAPDIQRRRGISAISRHSWTA